MGEGGCADTEEFVLICENAVLFDRAARLRYDIKKDTHFERRIAVGKRIASILAVLLLLFAAGCSSPAENEPENSAVSDEEQTVGGSEAALPYVKKAAEQYTPVPDGAQRSFVYRRRTTKSGEVKCYIFNVVDDFGDRQCVTARYAASADGSVVLRYDIVTDTYLPPEALAE